MLNCVNNLNLEPQSMNSGIERAALMISEEKHQQDSRKKTTSSIHCRFRLFVILRTCLFGSQRAFGRFYFPFSRCIELYNIKCVAPKEAR